jgi:hypothetical protein
MPGALQRLRLGATDSAMLASHQSDAAQDLLPPGAADYFAMRAAHRSLNVWFTTLSAENYVKDSMAYPRIGARTLFAWAVHCSEHSSIDYR